MLKTKVIKSAFKCLHKAINVSNILKQPILFHLKMTFVILGIVLDLNLELYDLLYECFKQSIFLNTKKEDF